MLMGIDWGAGESSKTGMAAVPVTEKTFNSTYVFCPVRCGDRVRAYPSRPAAR